MNIVVCVKQIPDPAMPGQLDPGSKTLKREGKLIMDESDSFGVEMGLQLAEKAGGGEVTIVSMVPAAGAQGIRSALAMGAAKAILVSDDALAGTDALGTAKVLAAAIRRAADLDLAASQVGWPGARQEITDVRQAEERQAGEKIEDEGDAHEKIVAFLEQLKVI